MSPISGATSFAHLIALSPAFFDSRSSGGNGVRLDCRYHPDQIAVGDRCRSRAQFDAVHRRPTTMMVDNEPQSCRVWCLRRLPVMGSAGGVRRWCSGLSRGARIRLRTQRPMHPKLLGAIGPVQAFTSEQTGQCELRGGVERPIRGRAKLDPGTGGVDLTSHILVFSSVVARSLGRIA